MRQSATQVIRRATGSDRSKFEGAVQELKAKAGRRRAMRKIPKEASSKTAGELKKSL
jgi:hypothetical protein